MVDLNKFLGTSKQESPSTSVDLSQFKGATPETPSTNQQNSSGTSVDLSQFIGKKPSGVEAIAGTVKASIIEPTKAIKSGFLKGVYETDAAFYGAIDGISKGLQKIGLPYTGIFGEIEQEFRQKASEVEKANLPAPAETVYELVGSLPVEAAKFAGARAIPAVQALSKVGGSQLSDIAAFGVNQAIQQFSEDKDMQSAIQGFASGASVAAAMPIGGKIIEQGIKVMNGFGKKAAVKYLQFVTGDKKLAEDFVANPNKYNLRNVKGQIESEDFKKDISLTLEQTKERNRQQMFDFRAEKEAKRNELNVKIQDAKEKMSNAQKLSQESMKEGSAIKLQSLVKASDEAVAANQSALKDEITSLYDVFIKKSQALKQQKGEAVGEAINDIIKKDPLASVQASAVVKKVNSIVKNKELSPFSVSKGGIESVTKATDEADFNTFNRVYTHFNELAAEGKMSLQYLQSLKDDARSLSSKAFSKGDGRLGKFYAELSDAVNPVNLVDDSKAFIYANPQLEKSLLALKEANKDYASIMPAYREAEAQFFTKDANDKMIPNINRLVSALKNDDVVTLRLMKKADSLLPKEDRIFDKVVSAVKRAEEFNSKQEAMISGIKVQAKKEYQKLVESNRKSLADLNKKSSKIGFEESRKAKEEIFNLGRKQEADYKALVKSLDDKLTILQREEKLKSFVGKDVARIGQSIAGFGAAAALKYGNIPSAVGGAAVFAGLSPAVASRAVKTAGRFAPFIRGGATKVAQASQRLAPKLVTASLSDKM